jgi:hypothetical protein
MRTVAAELAAWLPPGRLSDALDDVVANDTEEQVRGAAFDALARQRRERIVRELAAVFPDAPWERRWTLLVAMLDVGDPYLLSDRNDPLWLGHILAEAPFAYARHAEAALKTRKQKAVYSRSSRCSKVSVRRGACVVKAPEVAAVEHAEAYPSGGGAPRRA